MKFKDFFTDEKWQDSMPPLLPLNSYGTLKALGVKKIFSGGDLSGIVNTNMQITQYLQQMHINVDEKGTKITVSTGWSGDPTATIGSKCFINSPFVYMIRERSTGVILAIGKVQTMAGMQ